MQIRFWGVRGSLPVAGPEHRAYGGETACIEVRIGAEVLVLDLGSAAFRLGEALESEGDPGRITVLFSHGHYDHVCGLPFFAPLRRPTASTLLVSGVAGGTRAMVDDLLRPPFFPVGRDVVAPAARFADVAAGDGFTLPGGIRVLTAPTRHDGGALAYRIEHGSRAVVYGGDHEAGDPATDAGLVALMAGADLAILDATGGAPFAAGTGGRGHSTWRQAIELACRAGVGRVLLTHHHPASTDAGLDRLAVAAAALWPKAGLARAGDCVDISRCDPSP